MALRRTSSESHYSPFGCGPAVPGIRLLRCFKIACVPLWKENRYLSIRITKPERARIRHHVLQTVSTVQYLLIGRYVVGMWSVCGWYVVGMWSVCTVIWMWSDAVGMWLVCGRNMVAMWSVCGQYHNNVSPDCPQRVPIQRNALHVLHGTHFVRQSGG